MPTTTHYSIYLPTPGQSKNTWGNELNQAFQSLENEVYTTDQVLGDAADSATPNLADDARDAKTDAAAAKTAAESALGVP